MRAKQVNPIEGIYRPLQLTAEHFNWALFGGALPAHVFTLQRSKGTAGFFSPHRWRHIDEETRMSEIALNPAALANRPLWRLFQTIAREQCHLWQHTHGTPGRPGYHNLEWSTKMEEIGLMPSSTGVPGGARTGQKLGVYPMVGGKFLVACEALLCSGLTFPWVDQGGCLAPSSNDRLDIPGIESEVLAKLNAPLNAQRAWPSPFDHDAAARKRKVTYRCPVCGNKVWGKPDLELRCVGCDISYEPICG